MKFLVVTQTSFPFTSFSIKSLVNVERIDVAIRTMLACFAGNLISPRECLLYFSKNNVLVTVKPSFVKDFTELGIGEKLSKISSRLGLQDSLPFQSPNSDLIITKINFSQLIQQILNQGYLLVLLHSRGNDKATFFANLQNTNYCFVLGAKEDLDSTQVSVLQKNKVQSLSLSSTELLASQVITLIRYYITCSS